MSDERWSRFERDLLGAGRRDAPRPGARRRALRALGAGVGAIGSSTAATVTAATRTVVTTGIGAGKIAVVAAAKWVGLGIVAVGAAAVAIHVERGAPRPAESPATHAAEVVSTARPGAPQPLVAPSTNDLFAASSVEEESPAPAEPPATPLAPPVASPSHAPSLPTVLRARDAEETAPIAATDSPPVPAQVGAAVPAMPGLPLPPVQPTASAAPAESANPDAPTLHGELAAPTVRWSAERLAEETSSLESVRAALRGSDPASALRRLDRYRAAFPHGLLEPESLALGIEAHVAHGDRAQAEALASRFLTAFPRHPMAPRVRALLER